MTSAVSAWFFRLFVGVGVHIGLLLDDDIVVVSTVRDMNAMST